MSPARVVLAHDAGNRANNQDAANQPMIKQVQDSYVKILNEQVCVKTRAAQSKCN